jgi:glucose-1-phosphate thymidylyltransferase
MKALILAAGYATRLYPLTENQPKPLLKVAGTPIMEYILQKIHKIDTITEVFVVTNNKFHQHFIDWNKSYQSNIPITIVNDGTMSNEDRLGAIGDINFVIKNHSIQDDLMVIAGDNLFGFSLQNFVNHFKETASSTLALLDLQDVERVRNKYGVGILDGTKIVGFEEKPSEPRSTLAATACYLFTKYDLPLVSNFAEQSDADAPGNLIPWLVECSKMHGFVFTDHWFDIGSLEALEQANEVYK